MYLNILNEFILLKKPKDLYTKSLKMEVSGRNGTEKKTDVKKEFISFTLQFERNKN
jgi:hypothetical protein